jgi:phenylacetic acid degradation operon negative regulatory protein
MTQAGNVAPEGALTARSVLASTLLGAQPPDLPVAHLVGLAALFGINENRARVALSRMVAAGEATTDGSGHYRVAGHLLERQRRQTSSRAGRTNPWGGRWHLVVVTTAGSTAEVRGRRRRVLALSRLAELREGTWLRPDNVDLVLPADLGPDLERFTARPEAPGVLAGRLWDLDAWVARADDLLERLAARSPADWTDLAPGFVLSAAVLRHLQADPLLPPELLPDGWPGRSLRRAYDEWDARYRRVLGAWSRST